MAFEKEYKNIWHQICKLLPRNVSRRGQLLKSQLKMKSVGFVSTCMTKLPSAIFICSTTVTEWSLHNTQAASHLFMWVVSFLRCNNKIRATPNTLNFWPHFTTPLIHCTVFWLCPLIIPRHGLHGKHRLVLPRMCLLVRYLAMDILLLLSAYASGYLPSRCLAICICVTIFSLRKIIGR
jgi:hypothetical protein